MMVNFFKRTIICGLTLSLVFLTASPLLAAETTAAEEEAASTLAADGPSKTTSEITADVNVETGDSAGVIDVDNRVNINETDISNNGSSDGLQGDSSSGGAENVSKEEVGITEEQVDDIQTGEESGSDQTNNGDDCADCQPSGSSSASNDNTGEGSDNQAVASQQETVEVDNDNQAEVGNITQGSVETGSNELTDNLANVDLDTGEIQLISNIFNLINFNVVGTDYLGSAYSLVGDIIGDLDLSRYNSSQLAELVEGDQDFQELKLAVTNEETGDDSNNSAQAEKGSSTVIDNDNQATVNNDVTLVADSGSNEVTSNAGKVKVVTGNISIAANLVNIVNTNIIGNGWTLAIINIVGSWVGDLVLPSLTNLISSQRSDFSLTCDDLDCLQDLPLGAVNAATGEGSDNQAVASQTQSLFIDNDNDATVTNDVEAIVNSGDNEVAGNDGEVEVTTGDATAISSTYNQVNANIFQSGWVYGLVNVMGNWLGGFYGQPESGFLVDQSGGSWQFTYDPSQLEQAVGPSPVSVDGSELDTDSPGASNENTGEDSQNEAAAVNQKSTIITNDNEAVVNNKINIFGNSGGNLVAGNGSDVNLQTGNVNALANILNMVNTNMVGDNWTMAVVNIIGDWEGNLQFGKPDLILNEITKPNPDPAVPSGYIDYYITVTNIGDAPATEVEITTEVEEDKVIVTDHEDGEYQDQSGQITWLIPRIGIGETVVKHYRAQVRQQINAGDDVNNHTEAWAVEGDRNPEDNVAYTKVIINSSGLQFGIGYPVANVTSDNQENPADSVYNDPVFNNALQIKKSSDVGEEVYRQQTVNYNINLYNTSSEPLNDVIVYDYLRNPNGELVSSQSWKLGEVLPHEDINITYSINIGADALAGEYINYASADGFDAEGRYSLFPEAHSSIEVSDYQAATAGNFIDLQYSYQAEKKVGQSGEESLVITNLGKDTVPSGQVVLTFDGEALTVDGDFSGGKKYDLPALAPEENYTLQFQVAGRQETDSTLLNISYLSRGGVLASLTAAYQIDVEEEVQPLLKGTDQDGQQLSTKQIDQEVLPEKEKKREVKVLGYARSFNDLMPAAPLSTAGYFWSSLYDNLLSGWFWLALFVVLLLIELYRRYRRGDKFLEKTFGFRIF